MDKSHIETLIARWRKQKIALNPGAADQQLIDAEIRLGIRFPDDMRTFFRVCNGFDTREGHHLDEECNNVFLPIEEIATVDDYTQDSTKYYTDKRNYVFIDHCIAASFIVCRLTDSRENPAPVFWDDCGGVLTPIRPSFGEFIELYANDPEAIFRDF